MLVVKARKPEHWNKDEFKNAFFASKTAALASHELRPLIDSLEVRRIVMVYCSP